MEKRAVATNLFNRLLIISISIVLLSGTSQTLSDKRLCADENCKEIISLGTGKINYRAGEEGMVSFNINSPIRIKSKSAGKDLSVWGVEVNGREGYAPKALITETKILIKEKDLKFEVDVVKPGTEKPNLSISEETVAKESVETTTTQPLKFMPTEPVEKPLSTMPTEVTKIESTNVATTALMETVDGTQIPKIDYDSDDMAENIEVYGDDDDKDEIGDYDEEEEDDQDVKLNESKNWKAAESIVHENVKNKIINQTVHEDAKTLIASENMEESLLSDDNSIHNQRSSVIPEGDETKDEYKNIQEKPFEVEGNTAERTIISYDSNSEDMTAEIQNISEYENGEKSEELSVNHIEQMNNNNTSNEHNEKEAKEKTTTNEMEGNTSSSTGVEALNNNIENDENVEKDLIKENKLFNDNFFASLNSSNNILDNNTPQKNIPYIGNDVDSENGKTAKKDLPETTESLKDNLENSPKFHNITPEEYGSSPGNTVDHEDERRVELDSTKANEPPKENLENQTMFSNNTPLENVPYSDNVTDDSNKQTETSTFKDINMHPVASESSELNSESLASISTPGEHEEIYTTTMSPQVMDKKSASDANITPLEQQLYNEKKEDKPQATTSIETSTDIQTPQYRNNEVSYLSSQATEVPDNSLYEHQSTYYENAVYESTYDAENPLQNSNSFDDSITIGYNSVEPHASDTNTDFTTNNEEKQTKTPPSENFDAKENKGLFATIMGTVNNVLSIDKKIKYNAHKDTNELDRILFSKINGENKLKTTTEEDIQYCKQIGPNGDCPHQEHEFKAPTANCDCSIMDSVLSSDLTFDVFIKALAAKVLEISEVLAFLVIVAAASLFFIFGYYCFCNSSREGALLSKLNQLESSLLALQKENAILKHNLMSTRQKLSSIEDNSFGSNDMVVSLKKELEDELLEKARLQDQITALQKELENAADAGIELNKIVSELLSNQTGDESIISSVEELQKQLNEQQNTILEINASLAEKSRENSELQLLIAEQNARYESELANLQRDNDELEHEKGNLLSRLEELKNDFDRDITTALEGKNIEIKRLQSEILELNKKIESEHTRWQTSVAKVEALEECLKNVRKDPSVNITEIIDVINVKAQLLEAQKKYKTLKERLETEVDTRKLAENQLEIISAEVEKLKQDFNQSEKDKLEAQTRLEVLSNYFKEKENQLQKELSLKEAMWLKQQGETTTTVDRLTAMQEEIQSLKSQNDSLRAEIEAQVAAHKAQTGTLENRAHETWLAARQSDRRYEEARAEATALRRKLTALAGGNINEGNNKPSAGPITLGEDLTNVPSPIHMESPGSPLLGRMPPPPFLPPPFLGPPPPFIGMPPPPPFVPSGEMRPAPLGRIMSPPPQRSGRFSPQHLDYEDYLDYEGNNTWHRHTYSPPPRTYRSLSPTDSRYDYGTERDLMSTYDTETDFSPPPSPRETRRRGGNNSEKSDLSKNAYNSKRFNNTGPLSSGSEKSYNSPSHHDTKTKKGSTGGKSIV